MSTSTSQTSQDHLTEILDHFSNDFEPFSPGQIKDFLLTVLLDTWANPKGALLNEKEHGFTVYKLHQCVLMLEKLEKPREFGKALDKQLHVYGMSIPQMREAMIYAVNRGQESQAKYDKQMTDLLRRLWAALEAKAV